MTSNPGLYFKTDDDKIIIFNDDFLKLDLIKVGSIDLIVTSPPYNVDIPYHSTRDNGPYINYLKFSELWLNKALSLVKSDGRMCLNIPLDKNRGGQESIYADLVTIAKRIGWKYHSTIIWNEGNISRRTAWGSFQNARAPYVIAPVEAIVVLYKIEWKKREKGHSDISREEFITWTNALWSFSGENRKNLGTHLHILLNYQ
jgi:site-specific DNA-methyltransferase (adenine-specific)